MKKNKKGFTLSEILIVMLIIGTIMALSLQSIRIVKTSYTNLAFFAFKNLQIIARDMYGGQTSRMTAEEAGVVMCTMKNGKTTHFLKPDKAVQEKKGEILKCSDLPHDESDNPSVFCQLLVKSLNTSGKINCNNLYSASGNMGKDPVISNINLNNPNFITTNGSRYYLTMRTFNESVSKDYGYRLIAIDLNGKTSPNISEKTQGKNPPDIVTFMIMDNGEVFPLGVAADNMQVTKEKTAQYIMAKVKGYYYSNNPDRTGVPDVCFVKKKGGKQQTCNFGVVSLQNSKGQSTYGYREAYCSALGKDKKALYENYCDGIVRQEKCPPSGDSKKFDACYVETIKPLFRFNLV